MKNNPGQWPLFLFLLPVFFVFHGFVENARYIYFPDCLPLMGKYLIASLILFVPMYIFLKNGIKAGLAASFVMAFYLFFGYFHDFLRKHSIFLHRYSILLPVFLILTILLTLYLKKRAPFARLALFLNILFLSYILVDGTIWAWKTARKTQVKPETTPLLSGREGKCDDCPRPDIYLLIFDEYSGSQTLKDLYHYENSGLDSFLHEEGFHIQRNSRSNYYITPFSMASMLNCSYLKGISNLMDLKPDDYTNLAGPLRKSDVVNFLLSKGYLIYNFSPFDLPGHPSKVDLPFIPMKTKLITYRTMTDYIVRDMGAWIADHVNGSQQMFESNISQVYRMNQEFLALTREESGKPSANPRFFYTHVAMPHFPYLFDSQFRRRRQEEISWHQNKDSSKFYLGYLPYTNSRVRELITAIKKNSSGQAVILFMSDHGFRFNPQGRERPDFFNNQNAVYFPDGDYSMMYDSISNVNQFRVVFNKLFHLNLPLLKDSILFLRDNR